MRRSSRGKLPWTSIIYRPQKEMKMEIGAKEWPRLFLLNSNAGRQNTSITAIK